jgi:hypothetical protein
MPRDICALGLNVLPLALLENAAIIAGDLVQQAIDELGND